MKFAVIVLVALSVSGCGDNSVSLGQITEKSKIQEAIRASLKDPESAKFGEWGLINEKSACMTVNAKNGFGGYTGDQEAYLHKTQNKWKFITIIDTMSHEQCIRTMTGFK